MKTAFRRSLVALAAASVATLSMSFVTPAQAATPTVDVQQTLICCNQSALVMAQTFTAGTSAELVRVSLPFFTGFGNVTIGIQGVTSSGQPNGIYKTKMIWTGAQPCCGRFYDFNLTTPIAITKGGRYAIVVRLMAGSFNWYYSSFVPPGFSGGKLFESSCDTASCTWFSGGTFGADFGFKTWVSTSANQPPVVAADNASVTAPEGTAPSNTGTYSDPDGDTVALTASSGTLTRTGTSSGTWSWTAPVADEASMQPVIVTADDGQGQTATSSFNVTVSGVAPTAQILTDPISAPEGTAVPFTGGASSPDPADNAAGFTYQWSVAKDGSAF
ncbi:MAG TPA: hypothetical protein VEU76_01315, partial [Candidatus Udaeobacter sp.]|nr:hypothetical protein [Candidatus Udaeobacter sp.]